MSGNVIKKRVVQDPKIVALTNHLIEKNKLYELMKRMRFDEEDVYRKFGSQVEVLITREVSKMKPEKLGEIMSYLSDKTDPGIEKWHFNHCISPQFPNCNLVGEFTEVLRRMVVTFITFVVIGRLGQLQYCDVIPFYVPLVK